MVAGTRGWPPLPIRQSFCEGEVGTECASRRDRNVTGVQTALPICCGCGRIGSELAGSLGWKLWDQNLTCEIARRANVDESAVAMCEERVDGRLYRFAKAFWRGSYERSMPLA